MKPNKGFITVLMMVLISISLSTFSRAAFDTFSDVPNDSPFHESIFYLAERGIVCGEGNGRYVPDAPVTVRQWATMLCRALGDADPLNYDDDCIRQGYAGSCLPDRGTAPGMAVWRTSRVACPARRRDTATAPATICRSSARLPAGAVPVAADRRPRRRPVRKRCFAACPRQWFAVGS